jgi:hypothetical protein
LLDLVLVLDLQVDERKLYCHLDMPRLLRAGVYCDRWRVGELLLAIVDIPIDAKTKATAVVSSRVQMQSASFAIAQPISSSSSSSSSGWLQMSW